MRRRIKGIAGSAITWPLAVRAQQPAMSVVGFLSARSREDSADLLAALRAGLGETGFVEGRNVRIESRWANDHYDRLPPLFAAGLAAKAATSAIPVVFMIGFDPVQYGLVSSLNRPIGNVTGLAVLSNTLEPKQLQLLHEVVPTAKLVGFLANPKNPGAESDIRVVQSAASTTGQQILVVDASNDSELDTAFSALTQQHVEALLVMADPFLNSRPDKIVALASRYALQAMYALREFPVAGGLMSYGTNVSDALRQVGIYGGKILKGAKPTDLPVQQSVKVEFVLNLKTAKTLGLTVPTALLTTADTVIE
jgi:putative ABC transport system substrate-binding protein